MEIFSGMSRGQGYSITDDAREALKGVFERLHAARSETFGNGREARKLFERVLEQQSCRVVDDDQCDVSLITA